MTRASDAEKRARNKAAAQRYRANKKRRFAELEEENACLWDQVASMEDLKTLCLSLQARLEHVEHELQEVKGRLRGMEDPLLGKALSI